MINFDDNEIKCKAGVMTEKFDNLLSEYRPCHWYNWCWGIIHSTLSSQYVKEKSPRLGWRK